METQTARDINLLGAFCGPRDVEELSPAALRDRWGRDQADVMVLFGGSILAGGDELARAMQAGVARRYLIVGGAGHTTQTLREKIAEACPGMATDGLPEAQLFDGYLRRVYGLQADGLETASTNCGNNITFLLELMLRQQIPCRSIILCQDATMQRRMEAGLRKQAPDLEILNYAAYQARVTEGPQGLAYTTAIHGMWPMERYTQLLMGEIPRLTDDAQGYGPRGQGFIAHVDIPDPVQAAFARLKQRWADRVRTADPRYAAPATNH